MGFTRDESVLQPRAVDSMWAEIPRSGRCVFSALPRRSILHERLLGWSSWASAKNYEGHGSAILGKERSQLDLIFFFFGGLRDDEDGFEALSLGYLSELVRNSIEDNRLIKSLDVHDENSLTFAKCFLV